MEEMVEERTLVQADQVSVQTKMNGLPVEVAKVLKSRDVDDDVPKQQSLADLNRVEKVVESPFSSK